MTNAITVNAKSNETKIIKTLMAVLVVFDDGIKLDKSRDKLICELLHIC